MHVSQARRTGPDSGCTVHEPCSLARVSAPGRQPGFLDHGGCPARSVQTSTSTRSSAAIHERLIDRESNAPRDSLPVLPALSQSGRRRSRFVVRVLDRLNCGPTSLRAGATPPSQSPLRAMQLGVRHQQLLISLIKLGPRGTQLER